LLGLADGLALGTSVKFSPQGQKLSKGLGGGTNNFLDFLPIQGGAGAGGFGMTPPRGAIILGTTLSSIR